jgi:hypothetical protein
VEKKAKTHIKSTPNGAKLHRTHLEAHGRQPTKDGAIRAQLGWGRSHLRCPTPPLAPLVPIFGETVPLMLLMTVRVGFPLNIPHKPPFGGQFCSFHVEMAHFMISPLLSTYKRRLLPLSFTTTHQGKEHTLEHHSKV